MSQTTMHENRYCLDCNWIGPMNVHGRCSTCNSDAVVLAEHLVQYQRDRVKSIEECERIWQLR